MPPTSEQMYYMLCVNALYVNALYNHTYNACVYLSLSLYIYIYIYITHDIHTHTHILISTLD